MIFLKLLRDGTIQECSVPDKNYSLDTFVQSIQKKHAYLEILDIEGQYKFYGKNSGSIHKINKHELPPPIDNVRYYGSVFVCKVNSNNQLIDCTETCLLYTSPSPRD